jgi:predicted nucleic acid-binding protein
VKRTVYLDTTIPSYLFDERDSMETYIEITKRWWSQERHKFDLWISEETIAELSSGDYPNKKQILACASEIAVLPTDVSLVSIVDTYIKNYLMPQTRTGDAVHLAYASYYKIDFLLTWNCNHLANANKKQHIRIINSRMNLFTPEIATPLELFSETDT